MSSVDFTVKGIPELVKALDGLPLAIKNDALRKAIPQAGEMVRSAIASAVPTGPYSRGRLRASIVFYATQVGGVPSGVVIPNRKRGRAVGHHAHLVEYGTAPHQASYYRHPYQHPGTAPQPFWHPAVDATEGRAIDAMMAIATAEIADYWARQGGAS